MTFMAVALATLPGREALRLAEYAGTRIQQSTLVILAILIAVSACSFTVWLAGTIAPLLSQDQSRWLAAAALALAAFEVFVILEKAKPKEPTHSLGALAIVLFAGLVTDSSGFIILAVAVATDASILAGIGGALAVAAVFVSAIFAAGQWVQLPRKPLRIAVGATLSVGAILIGLGYAG